MPGSWLARVQVVEYLRAFLIGRTGWSRFGALILISGAFGMFRRDVLVEVGGLDADSIGEDFELVLRMHRCCGPAAGLPRLFVAEPISGPRCPSPRGAAQPAPAVAPRALGDPVEVPRDAVRPALRPGRPGRRCPTTGPSSCWPRCSRLAGLVLVVLGLALGVVNLSYAYVFLAVAYGYAILVTLAAMTVEELSFHKYDRWRDLRSTLAASIWENVGYRQATAWWRLEGWWAGLTGRKQVWGTMTRQGFAGTEPAAVEPALTGSPGPREDSRG